MALAAEAPLRVGVETDLHPISSIDRAGRPAGFAVDLLDAISRDTGLRVEYVVRPRADMFDDFNGGRVDALASVVYARGREKTMALSVTDLELRGSLFVRKDSPALQSAEDLRQLRVIGIPNSQGYDYLQDHHYDAHFVAATTMRDAMHKLASHEGDVVLATRLFGQEFIQNDHLDGITLSPIEPPDLVYRFHIALHPDDRLRLAVINESLARLRAEGMYDRIYEKWIGRLEPRPLRFEDVERYVPLVAVLLLVVSGAFWWQRRLVRKIARQADELRASEERLQLVLEGSRDGFWDWDLRTGRIERSERWAGMLGYTLVEIPPTLEAGTSLVHPDDVAAYREWETQLDGGAESYAIEYRMRAKNGDWRWVLDRGKVVGRDAAGHPLRMAGTHTDITQRKRTEAALLESQTLLRRSAHLLEQTQAGARIGGWEIDLRTDRIFWTRETYRLLETTPADFHPTIDGVMAFYAPAARPTITAALEEAVRLGTPYELEIDLVTAKQRTITVRATGAVEKEDGRVRRVYGSFRDITAEKNAEQEREKLRLKMLEAQKLESLGVLAGGIAHDFNNLLTVILANATFMRAERTAHDERLAHIESASRRAADLCRQMLAYAGRGHFVVESIDVGTLLRDTAQLIHVSISKKAHLDLSLALDLPHVEGDASQLRQVIMNLVINASEALADAPGEIRLATRLGRPEAAPGVIIHSFDLPPGDCVCLEIADTGQGMSPATLARIFDPFFTTKFAGRGLGLAAVLGIVRVHRGALTVSSRPGAGSVFRLFLPPIGQTAEISAPLPAAEPRASAGGRILVAEDEPVVLATTDAVLRHHGYQTVLAADGHEAVSHFRAEAARLSAVLLDLTMPGLDGAEVLREIRALNPTMPVVVMSGYSEQDVFNRLRGLGQVAIIRKPFTQQTLLHRLAEATRQEPVAGAAAP